MSESGQNLRANQRQTYVAESEADVKPLMAPAHFCVGRYSNAAAGQLAVVNLSEGSLERSA
jgi:hypothetical protein